MAVMVRSASSLGGLFIHALVLESAELAGINFSLVLNLYSLTPFLTAVMFFIFFRERLAKLHIVGMFCIFACVAITGESNKEKADTTPGNISILIPLVLAIVATLFYTCTNFVSRLFVQKCHISSGQLLADSCLVQAIVLLTVFLVRPNPYEFDIILSMALLSLVTVFGNVLVNESIVHGKAGPTSALCEVQSLWLLVLEVYFLGKIPTVL